MLTGLDIQNVVLIERLSLAGHAGLVALTGETGAGKSILLDALGLALGARADAGLVRHGADQAVVSAAFDLPAKHVLIKELADKGIDAKDGVILRRVVGAEGKSKAFINDMPVSVQLLKETGNALVEIHGQFETMGLLDPANHIGALDRAGGIDAASLKKAYTEWKTAKNALQEAEASIATLKLQEEYLRHVVKELDDFAPLEGEEEILSVKRQKLKDLEKSVSAFDAVTDIIESAEGLREGVNKLNMVLVRLQQADLVDALARAKAEIDEISYQIERLKSGAGLPEESLEEIEDRYFTLKDLAKKHRVTPDELPQILHDMQQKLRLITDQDQALADLSATVNKTRRAFLQLAEKISVEREKAAEKISKAVNAELPDLKLDKATFKIDVARQSDENNWNENGMDRVQFMVSTNPGSPMGPLHKIASGGELSRFTLALKAVLAKSGGAPVLIFDEVDSGIGGATADAVGERLQRLSKTHQVLVVTHSPQVAARASRHWHVAKHDKKGIVTTTISALETAAQRAEEIARMLSGAKITDAARAQAESLLNNAA